MTNSIPALLAALSLVESAGNDKAFNPRELAVGRYQIRPAYFMDSGVRGQHSQCTNPAVAQAVVLAYFKRYEPRALQFGNVEVLARLHNAGPGWRKHLEWTNKYWSKVKAKLK
jgi:hypothetical protein